MKLDFVSVGPMRAGTTWLHENLVRHPGIVLPRLKETFYFDRNYDRGLGWYEKHFPEARTPSVVRGEIGASYFDAPLVIDRIASLNEACRIVVHVRDPVARAYSTYLHFLKNRLVPEGLEQAIAAEPRIVDSSRYSVHVPRWEKAFGKERVHFVWLEDVTSRPAEVIDEVCQFLQVEPLDGAAVRADRINAAVRPGHRLIQAGRRSLYGWLRDRHMARTISVASRVSREMERLLRSNRTQDAAPSMADAERMLLLRTLAGECAFLEERLGRRLAPPGQAHRNGSPQPPEKAHARSDC